MRQPQRAGLIRLLAIAALFLGLVSMHHLSIAQCDPAEHVQLAASSSAGQSSVSSHSPTSPSAERTNSGLHQQARDHTHENLLLGCMCMIAMCVAIIALMMRLFPRIESQHLRGSERTKLPPARFLYRHAPRPPNLLALSVSRT